VATIEEAFRLALAEHQAGRLPRAEQLYRQILTAVPRHADARHLLGLVGHQSGRSEMAVEYIRQAITLNPGFEIYYVNLGGVYLDLGKLDEAIDCFKQALSIRPDLAAAYYNLTNALRLRGRLDDAVRSGREAVRLSPDNPEAHNALGAALQEQGHLAEAESQFEHALELKPNLADAAFNMGNVLRLQRRFDEALRWCEQACRLQPQSSQSWSNLAAALQGLGRIDEARRSLRESLRLNPRNVEALSNLAVVLQIVEETDLEVARQQAEDAIACCLQALEIQPNFVPAHVNLGNSRQQQGRIDEAIACYRRAIEIDPNSVDARCSLSDALRNRGQLDEAREHFEHALRRGPDYPEARFNKALWHLVQGDLPAGWPHYEYRWQMKGVKPRQKFSQPTWDGASLPGNTILLHAEQGHGDSLQFIRYAALVKQRVGTVLVECPGTLVDLLASCPGVDLAAARGQPLPEFDVQAPLLSLPGILQTSLETIPATVPYLWPSEDMVRAWQRELPSGGPLKVGIVWQGSPLHHDDRKRSIPLEQFAPLTAIPGVQLYALQFGAGHDQLQKFSAADRVIDLADRISNFQDTAAIMRNLDLVISCDSAPVHLAGALGVPVWTALPQGPDWRWMLEREDSPWYPTMRLWRQRSLGDWTELFERIADQLRSLASDRC
jgi:tetratricopeptide (TPR) repeat protein